MALVVFLPGLGIVFSLLAAGIISGRPAESDRQCRRFNNGFQRSAPGRRSMWAATAGVSSAGLPSDTVVQLGSASHRRLSSHQAAGGLFLKYLDEVGSLAAVHDRKSEAREGASGP